MTDTKRWTRRGSTIQRLAGSRLMDVTPARVEALQLRILAALKRGKAKEARELLVRRSAICDLLNEGLKDRQIVERLIEDINDAIASGMSEEQIAASQRDISPTGERISTGKFD